MKIFILIAQKGTISAAANELGYAQSNISTKIRQLETELGTPLFYRHNRGITLTDSGHDLLKQAIRIVDLTERTINQIKHPNDIHGRLRIGTLQTAATTFLPKILANYHTNNPQVKLTIQTGTTLDSIKGILNYELDGAIIGGKISNTELSIVPLLTESLSLIAPLKNINIQDIPLLVFPVGCAYRNTLENWLDSKNIKLHHPIEFNYLNAIVASVSAGLGISILPKNIVQPYLDSKVVIELPLPQKYTTLPISFIYRQDYVIGPAMKQFMTFLDPKIV